MNVNLSNLKIFSFEIIYSFNLATINYQCERESVTNEQLNNFRRFVLKRAENFLEKNDRWLAIHQLLHHAYQNYIPLPYIYAIYDSMCLQNYEYRPHYMRPILVKLQRIFINKPEEMSNQLYEFLNYLQKNFSINYDNETIDLLIEFFFEKCHLKPSDIDIIFKKVKIHLNNYWLNLYFLTLKRINIDLLNSLKIFFNTNKNTRFEYTSMIREQTIQAIQSLVNQLDINSDQILNHFKIIIDFIDIINKRFVKNSNDIIALNDGILITIANWVLDKEHKKKIELLKQILNLFEKQSQTIPLTNETKEKIYKQLGNETFCCTSKFLLKFFFLKV